MTDPSDRHIAVLRFFGLASAAFLIAMLLSAEPLFSRHPTDTATACYILACTAFALSLAAISLSMLQILDPDIPDPRYTRFHPKATRFAVLTFVVGVLSLAIFLILFALAITSPYT